MDNNPAPDGTASRALRHYFNPNVAMLVSVQTAVVFQNIAFWIIRNEGNPAKLKEGRYWTYTTPEQLRDWQPYLTAKQIRTALKQLVDAGLLITGCFNRHRYDKTKWYTFGPQGQEFGEAMGVKHRSHPASTQRQLPHR